MLAILLGTWAVANAQVKSNELTGETGSAKTVKFKVTGMTCGGCANHISTALQKLDGVLEEDVEFPGDIAVVKFDPRRLDEKKIIKTIEGAGYKAQVMKTGDQKSKKGSQ